MTNSNYDELKFTSKKYKTISFLSDLGTQDESIASCKAIMRQQCEDVVIMDITHEVPPFDVRFAALVLTRAIQFLNEGIIVAAVDPGAPKDQRFIAVELDGGVLIGPDNGILAPAVRIIGEPKRVHAITNPTFRYPTPSETFAARDILAPAAGLIANGLDISEFGPSIPLSELVPVLLEAATFDKGGALYAEVWSIDRFGNIELNITPEDLDVARARLGDNIILRIGEKDYVAKYVERYADLGISELGLVNDSTGLICIVKNLDNAARGFELKAGRSLTLLPPNTTATGELDENVQYRVEVDETNESGPMIAPSEPLSPMPDQIPRQPYVPPRAQSEPIVPPSAPQPYQEPQVAPQNYEQQPAPENLQPFEQQYVPEQVPPSNFQEPAPSEQPQRPMYDKQPLQPQAPEQEQPLQQPPQQPSHEQPIAPPQQPPAPPQDEYVDEPPQEQIPSDSFSGIIAPTHQPLPPVDAVQPPNPYVQTPPAQPSSPDPTQAQPQAQPPATIPENVFDLFKEDTDPENPEQNNQGQ